MTKKLITLGVSYLLETELYTHSHSLLHGNIINYNGDIA